jgi:hypothetical protein
MTPEQKRALEEYQAAIDGYRNGQPAQYSVQDSLGVDELGPSAMEGVETDPRYKEHELAALKELEDSARNGFTAQDKADMSRAEMDVNRQNHGRLGAIQQNMQSRGMGGSGMDIMAQLQSAQDSNDVAAMRDLEREGQMQARKSQATRDLGHMSMGMQGQEWNQAAQKAQAQDAIARFNSANRNNANQWNTQNAQNVANSNVGVNNGFAQTSANMGMQGAEMGYNAATEEENRRLLAEQQKRQRAAAKRAAVGQTIGMVAGGVAGSMGGPMGAAAGAQAGGALGGGVANATGPGYAHGGEIPGHAKHAGDDPRNDTVHAMLSPGEIVIPRTEADAVGDLLQAVANLHKAKGKK